MADLNCNNLIATNSVTCLTMTGNVIHTFYPLTFGASVYIPSEKADIFSLTCTSNAACAIAAPGNPATGKIIYLVNRNTSGGAVALKTWDAVFKMDTWSGTDEPATGFNRTIAFIYNGANWIEFMKQGVDIPN